MAKYDDEEIHRSEEEHHDYEAGCIAAGIASAFTVGFMLQPEMPIWKRIGSSVYLAFIINSVFFITQIIIANRSIFFPRFLNKCSTLLKGIIFSLILIVIATLVILIREGKILNV